ncbi:uncharacterized protein [Centruroides vittatus]|uniref:uncharacterized protein n=1 Tax=Centruroides vittatus TaxID=120091 RepID=UPI00350FFA0B
MLSNYNNEILQQDANKILDKIHEWCVNNNLQVNFNKCEAMVLSKGRQLKKPLRIFMNHQRIKNTTSLKYLGLTFDQNMRWASHITNVTNRAIKISNALQCISHRSWGMNEKFIKIIYKACIETIILYGAPFWAEAVDNVRTKKKLNKAQRLSLLRLCRAYRTALTAALQVLSGVLPLHIRAKEEMWRWHLLNGGTIDGQDSELYKFMEIGLFPNLNEPLLSHLTSNLNGKPEVSEPHPSIAGDISILDFHDNPNYYIQIFTDRSKSHSKVGSAFVVKECNNSNFSYQASYRLASICTITQAEQFAILQALKYVNNSKIRNRHIRICSDSQVAIRRIVNNLGSLSLLIREEILCSQNSVAFSWIRGHTGVEGNSLADSLAKQAAASSATPPTGKPQTSLLKPRFTVPPSSCGNASGKTETPEERPTNTFQTSRPDFKTRTSAPTSITHSS